MARLLLHTLLWGCWLTTVHAEPCNQRQYQVNGRCCDLCRPGTVLRNDCSEGISTDCRPCSTGEFMGTWNRERRCHQHSHCDSILGFRVQSEGTLEKDSICICKEGWHCTSHACRICAEHSSCPAGFGVQEIATSNADTTCTPCPDGFFSNVSSANDKCRPWTSCRTKGLAEVKAGTTMTDVLCGPWPRSRALLAIPCTLGALLALLVMAAVIKRVLKKSKKKAALPEDQGKEPVEVIFLEDVPGANTVAPVQETLHGCQPVTQEDGKESRVSVQERF
ncbi:tumor necrosis factor receptor superfamily member 5 [Tenrec ecaudatus]|uniref:tumor necrosis factor receptor superfamily member 5 n=1 Tax=Tenrec ecaudatus TaxID=94439 RepID=UPI003F595EB9